LKDPKAEQMLQAHLVDFVYVEDVDITQVDVELSLRNQARIDPPLHTDTVASYAEAARDGADFPAIIGYYDDNGKFVVIDGNHRVNAFLKAGIKTIDVYVVEAAQDVIQALTYMANATHGRPPTEEERLHHAIHLRDLGYGNKEAARALGLTEGKVSQAWQLEGQMRRARRLGVQKAVQALNKDIRVKVNPIQSDNVFKTLVTFLATSKGLTRIEIADLVNSVRASTTEKDQLQAIVDFKETKQNEQRTQGRNKYRHNARQGLLPHLGYIHQQEPEAVRNATLTPEQRENLKEHLTKTVAFCSSLMKMIVEDEAAGEAK
jgi:hypothetical protein